MSCVISLMWLEAKQSDSGVAALASDASGKTEVEPISLICKKGISV